MFDMVIVVTIFFDSIMNMIGIMYRYYLLSVKKKKKYAILMGCRNIISLYQDGTVI